jgi:hypothetical protein
LLNFDRFQSQRSDIIRVKPHGVDFTGDQLTPVLGVGDYRRFSGIVPPLANEPRGTESRQTQPRGDDGNRAESLWHGWHSEFPPTGLSAGPNVPGGPPDQ